MHPRIGSLCVEGWRGVNHSYGLTNQHQLLALMQTKGLQLYHRDLPFAFPHWNRASNSAGFSPQDQAAIDALGDDVDDVADCVYRICSPFRLDGHDARKKLVTFMITETGLTKPNVVTSTGSLDGFTSGDNLIVTPTLWSKQRIVEYGFPAERIHIIPLGVDAQAFTPLEAELRVTSRANLGFAEDETVFLNIGVALWNKGIDVLLHAFALVRSQGYKVRLILKDQTDVYGISVQDTLRQVGEQCPALFDVDVFKALSIVRCNLSTPQLRLLYGVSDCYVSSYRAEGFNLPVLEAVTSGLPVIVTRGGATDDFCDDDVALRISGRAGVVNRPDHVARFIEPDLDELVQAMTAIARGAALERTRFAASRQRMIETFQWRHTAAALVRLTLGEHAAPALLAS